MRQVRKLKTLHFRNSINMRALLISLILVITFSPSCKKYDEGPSLSLLSKKQRLTGKWEVASFFFNGEELQLINKEEMTVNKNGTFSRTILIGTNSFNNDGNWAFSEDKKELILTYNSNTTENWIIKRLSNKQLFIEITQTTGTLIRYEYVKKVKQ